MANDQLYSQVLGTLVTGFACVLFALIDPSATYWAFGFPSTCMVVFGADFVYAAGTIFVAKIVLPHEQSVAGGLFQTMTQVSSETSIVSCQVIIGSIVLLTHPRAIDRNSFWSYDYYDRV